MSKQPPIPPEQQTFGKSKVADDHIERRDQATGVQSGEPGDADVNTRAQGRFGNLAQNVRAVHGKTPGG